MHDEKSYEKSLGVSHVQVRLTLAEKEALESAADSAGLKIQPFLRGLIAKAVSEMHEPSPSGVDGLDHRRQALVREYAEALRRNDDPSMIAVIETALRGIRATRALEERKRAG